MDNVSTTFTFIPISPTKEAWDSRLWKGTTYRLSDIVSECSSKPWIECKGQVICPVECATKDGKIPIDNGFGEVQYDIDDKHYILFNNKLELTTIINSMKVHSAKIKKIHLNRTGYFIVNGKP